MSAQRKGKRPEVLSGSAQALQPLYAEIFAKMSVGVVILHLADREDPASLTLVAANDVASIFAGIDLQAGIGQTIAAVQPDVLRTERPRIYAEVALSGRPCMLGETRSFVAKGDRTPMWAHVSALPLPNRCVAVTMEDITALKCAQEEAKKHEIFLNSVVENIPDMIFIKDAKELRFVRFNRAGEELLGFSREDLIGKSDYDFFPAEEADFFTMKDREAIARKKFVDIPDERIHTRNQGVRILHTKKIPLLDDGGHPQYLLGISADITEQKRVEAELLASREALRVQATRDALTGLWNRAAVLDLLNREMQRAKRQGTCVSIIMADLDRFKRVNDEHGHHAGDAVLAEAARRFRFALRNYDVVGRYGGEEFLIILSEVDDVSAASRAESLRSELASRPMEIGTARISITGSFGVAIARAGEDSDADGLTRAADDALYRAKRQGRNRVEVERH